MLDTASPDITTRFRNKFGTTEENGSCAVLNKASPDSMPLRASVIRSNLKENSNWIAMPINRITKTKFMKRFYWIFLFVLMVHPMLFAQQTQTQAEIDLETLQKNFNPNLTDISEIFAKEPKIWRDTLTPANPEHLKIWNDSSASSIRKKYELKKSWLEIFDKNQIVVDGSSDKNKLKISIEGIHFYKIINNKKTEGLDSLVFPYLKYEVQFEKDKKGNYLKDIDGNFIPSKDTLKYHVTSDTLFFDTIGNCINLLRKRNMESYEINPIKWERYWGVKVSPNLHYVRTKPVDENSIYTRQSYFDVFFEQQFRGFETKIFFLKTSAELEGILTTGSNDRRGINREVNWLNEIGARVTGKLIFGIKNGKYHTDSILGGKAPITYRIRMMDWIYGAILGSVYFGHPFKDVYNSDYGIITNKENPNYIITVGGAIYPAEKFFKEKLGGRLGIEYRYNYFGNKNAKYNMEYIGNTEHEIALSIAFPIKGKSAPPSQFVRYDSVYYCIEEPKKEEPEKPLTCESLIQNIKNHKECFGCDTLKKYFPDFVKAFTENIINNKGCIDCDTLKRHFPRLVKELITDNTKCFSHCDTLKKHFPYFQAMCDRCFCVTPKTPTPPTPGAPCCDILIADNKVYVKETNCIDIEKALDDNNLVDSVCPIVVYFSEGSSKLDCSRLPGKNNAIDCCYEKNEQKLSNLVEYLYELDEQNIKYSIHINAYTNNNEFKNNKEGNSKLQKARYNAVIQYLLDDEFKLNIIARKITTGGEPSLDKDKQKDRRAEIVITKDKKDGIRTPPPKNSDIIAQDFWDVVCASKDTVHIKKRVNNILSQLKWKDNITDNDIAEILKIASSEYSKPPYYISVSGKDEPKIKEVAKKLLCNDDNFNNDTCCPCGPELKPSIRCNPDRIKVVIDEKEKENIVIRFKQ